MRLLKTGALLIICLLLAAASFHCQPSALEKPAKPEKVEIKVGDKAPDFSLRNQDQIKISLSEFKDKKNVIIVFYPMDFTPV